MEFLHLILPAVVSVVAYLAGRKRGYRACLDRLLQDRIHVEKQRIEIQKVVDSYLDRRG